MKHTSSDTWEPMTLAELETLVDSDGGGISIKVNSDNSTITIFFTIPRSNVEGSIDWVAANATLTDVTSSEFQNLVTTQICNLGLSYDDKLGMRYFETIQDASGTCAN